MKVIAQKTGKNSLSFILNPNSFKEKMKENILVFDESELLSSIDFNVFRQYDAREKEIEERKSLVKGLKTKKFLNVQKAVIARGYKNDYYIIDVKSKEAKSIDSSLIDDEDVSEYRKDSIMTALRETGVNKFKSAKQRQEAIWKSIDLNKPLIF